MVWEHDHHCGHEEDIVIECGGDVTVGTRSSLVYETDDQSINRYTETKYHMADKCPKLLL